MSKCKKELEYDVTGAARYLGCRKQNVHMHIERGNINTVWRGHLGANGKEMILHSELLRFKHSKHWRKDNDR